MLNLIKTYLTDLGYKVEVINSGSVKRLRIYAASKDQAFTIASSLNKKFSEYLISASLLQPDLKTEMYYMHINSVAVAIIFPLDDEKNIFQN